ncbi:class E sortase [Nocardioides daeguensis]|uniref:Class E sortase n=1 Tax=Nocardioides daeguensis TaxID=908359 RepID=A0ABP6V5V6_9ACTN
MTGYVGWQFVGTNLVARHHQGVVTDEINADWDEEGTSGDAVDDRWRPGDGIALVRVPRFGDDYEMPLVAGTNDDDLARGIGWFPESARPGEVGNFAIAAHRVTHGEPFSKILDLRAGDEVIVETRTHVYTYRLVEDGDARVVDFTETWVLDPVPGKPASEPSESLITLVTCAEIFHTDDRNVVFGALQTAQRK